MQASDIIQLLPGVFQRAWRPQTPTDALVHAIVALLNPAENQIDHFDDIVSARRTPERFLPMLARWVDLDRFLDVSHAGRGGNAEPSLASGANCLRELIANAAYLSHWRGTRKGLLMFLEIATGVAGFEVDEDVRGADGRSRLYHIAVHAPPELRGHAPLIRRIIESEKPAYVTYDLLFDSQTRT